MGSIVVHAGMPKAASSSIQTWLKRHWGSLHRRHGIHVARAEAVRGPDGIARVAVDSRPRAFISSTIIKAFLDPDQDQARLSESFVQTLDGLARKNGTVLLTSEGFAQLFIRRNEPFLLALKKLTGDHQVTVAYYVRAQHEALEAAWRQWGFRSGHAPVKYLRLRMKMLDYLDTWQGVAEKAPGVRFLVRPLCPAFLGRNGVIADFAVHCLGLPEDADRDLNIRSNASLPLDVVNELQGRGPNALWKTSHENALLSKLKPVISKFGIEDSPKALESRAVLHGIAHKRFEQSNMELGHRLEWNIPYLIPPPTVQGANLASLDSLWGRTASDTARRLLIETLADLVK